jgi:hypothetical protein
MWLILAAMLAEEPPQPVAMPAWMAGCWEHKGAESWTEECWTVARAGQMMGSSRTGKGEALQWYEHTRITSENGAITFCALPKGQTGGCFKATKATKSEIVFENETHDYPQRIRYWRDGKDLAAEISLKDGTKASQWRYAPMGN